MQLDDLLFLHQVHSDTGVVVAGHPFDPFKKEGDYIITERKHIGIGVMTADCLPIVFFDTLHRVVSIVHAGWKGSALEVAPMAIARMQEVYKTKLEHIRVFFGPSAKSCCYAVDNTFTERLEAFSFADKVLIQQENGLMFDLPLFNKLQLEDMGIPKEAFKLEYNFCTICDVRYCSYRRSGADACRQMTAVALR